MKLKYFGFLDEAQIKNLDEDSIVNLLKEKKLITFSASIVSNDSVKRGISKLFYKKKHKLKTTNYNYSKHVAKDYMCFLLQHYSRLIESDVYKYKKDFVLQTNLLTDKKIKTFASKDFKNIFETIVDVKYIPLMKNRHGEIGINRFELIDREREYKYIDRLRNQKESIYHYLVGNTEFFDITFFDENPWLQEIIDFEIGSRILKYLNDKFLFEVKDSSKNNEKAKIIYEQYKSEFESLELIKFIVTQIESQENTNRAFYISLFYFFKKDLNLQMPSAVLFTQIINNNFNEDIGTIKAPSSSSKKQIERKETLKKEWKKFNSRM